jgi:GT2 family glycosyltransferase
MVSFNTRELTIRAIETLLDTAGDLDLEHIDWDNASADGSADAIEQRFDGVRVIRSPVNLGFGAANNAAAEMVDSEWLLLLNSDTEVLPGAIQALLAFGERHPDAGIVGGRTLWKDRTLNKTSCFAKMTPWSLFCSAVGLTALFPGSTLFNPELIGSWQRDSVRKVDIITGCLLLIRTELWNRLGGFNPRYFMYSEDVDLSHRAAALGYRPMITPDAEIVHIGGASAQSRPEKIVQGLRGRASIVRDHWSPAMRPIGLALMWLWIALRRLSLLVREPASSPWRAVWRQRRDWLKGY